MRRFFGMTIEEWEAVNATLLWINLKSGLLPLGDEVHRDRAMKSAAPRRTLRLLPRLRLVRPVKSGSADGSKPNTPSSKKRED